MRCITAIAIYTRICLNASFIRHSLFSFSFFFLFLLMQFQIRVNILILLVLLLFLSRYTSMYCFNITQEISFTTSSLCLSKLTTNAHDHLISASLSDIFHFISSFHIIISTPPSTPLPHPPQPIILPETFFLIPFFLFISSIRIYLPQPAYYLLPVYIQ